MVKGCKVVNKTNINKKIKFKVVKGSAVAYPLPPQGARDFSDVVDKLGTFLAM